MPGPAPGQPAPVQPAPASAARPTGTTVSPLISPGAATPPASPAAARRLGWIGAIIAVVLVLGAGVVVGYRMLFPEESALPAKAVEPKSATTAAQGESTKDTSPRAPAAASESSSMSAQPAPSSSAAGGDQAKAGTSAPAAGTSAPAATAAPAAAGSTPAAASGPPKADAAAQTRASTAAAPPAAAPGASPKGAAATPGAPAPATTAAQAGAARPAAAQGDRWEQMHQAMLRCGREEFLTRFVCEQRVGRQYCEGYWGTVPQCPGAPRERGQ